MSDALARLAKFAAHLDMPMEASHMRSLGKPALDYYGGEMEGKISARSPMLGYETVVAMYSDDYGGLRDMGEKRRLIATQCGWKGF